MTAQCHREYQHPHACEQLVGRESELQRATLPDGDFQGDLVEHESP